MFRETLIRLASQRRSIDSSLRYSSIERSSMKGFIETILANVDKKEKKQAMIRLCNHRIRFHHKSRSGDKLANFLDIELYHTGILHFERL